MAKIPDACKRKRRASSKLCCLFQLGSLNIRANFKAICFADVLKETDAAWPVAQDSLCLLFMGLKPLKRLIRCGRKCELLNEIPLSAIAEMLEEIWSLVWLPAEGSL